MPQSGLETFDKTVQETNRWLQAIGAELSTDDKQVAYHALRTVLFALRDRVPTDLAAGFSAQLPLLVRGIFYEGYRPADAPLKFRTLDEWNERVAQFFEAGGDYAPEQLTRAVFSVFNQELDRAEIEKVFTALPEDVRALWPDVPEAVAHQ